jgi:prevent-host-death family protein
MSTITLSSREFNQDTAAAKRAARKAPVIITDRGKPAFVLMQVAHYQKLKKQNTSIADLLAMPKSAPDFAFDPAKMSSSVFKPVKLV